jgi:hypothetical protein
MTPRIENFPWKFTVPSTRHSSFRSLLSGKEFACPMYVCATHTAVNPAKAGIHFQGCTRAKMDSRFRGNDGPKEYGDLESCPR